MNNITLKRFVAIGASALFAAHTFAADVTIGIAPTETHQTVIGIGGGLAYYQNWLTGHKNKTEIYDTLFNGLGISGLRMGNWAQEDDKDLSDDAEIVKEAKKRNTPNYPLPMILEAKMPKNAFYMLISVR